MCTAVVLAACACLNGMCVHYTYMWHVCEHICMHCICVVNCAAVHVHVCVCVCVCAHVHCTCVHLSLCNAFVGEVCVCICALEFALSVRSVFYYVCVFAAHV